MGNTTIQQRIPHMPPAMKCVKGPGGDAGEESARLVVS
jgi:hypothetical protein